MAINKKIMIPLVIITLLLAGGVGWYIWQHKGHDHLGEGKPTAGKQLYTCPMHPFIIKDNPGSCPVCGMDLIKKLSDAVKGGAETAEQKKQSDMISAVSISTTQRVMANVATVAAKNGILNKEINAVGIVQYDQSRQAKVTAWIAGRIDILHVNSIGSQVTKDKPVAEVYSPELLASQQEYLLAVKSREQLKNSSIPSISQSGDGLVASAKQRLMLFGVKDNQIAELEKAGKPNIRLPIFTPLSGIVIEKMVQQGQYVNSGDTLFSIADLSTVWVEIEVYENEFSNIHVGQQVEIRSQSFPNKPFFGQIAFIYPFLDPKTRTVKARVEMPNPDMKLKPDMFVNAIIKSSAGSGILLPLTAVIDTGKRQVVWIETSTGVFEPRDVQVGQRSDDKIQILSGIKVGDKVAVSGAYLIDSESQLKGAGAVDHTQHNKGGVGEKPAGTAGQAPAKKGKINMDDMKM